MEKLKVVKIGKKEYFLDLRLLELRNTKNPHEYIGLTELEAYLLLQLD